MLVPYLRTRLVNQDAAVRIFAPRLKLRCLVSTTFRHATSVPMQAMHQKSAQVYQLFGRIMGTAPLQDLRPSNNRAGPNYPSPVESVLIQVSQRTQDTWNFRLSEKRSAAQSKRYYFTIFARFRTSSGMARFNAFTTVSFMIISGSVSNFYWYSGNRGAFHNYVHH